MAALSLLAVLGCARKSTALDRGERVPALALGATAAPVGVVWVLRPDDFLTCQTAADGVRQLQQRFGASLPIRVVHVGPHPAWVRGFLRRQRIEADVTPMTERVFRKQFHRAPAAWLYLVRRGVVVDVLPGRGQVHPETRWPAEIGVAQGHARPGGGARAGEMNHSVQ